MEQRNGSTRLAYWIMGALLGLLTMMAGVGASELKSRIDAIDMIQKSRTDTLGEFRGEIGSLRQDVCRLEEKVDTLREDVTHKRVYRRPCP